MTVCVLVIAVKVSKAICLGDIRDVEKSNVYGYVYL